MCYVVGAYTSVVQVLCVVYVKYVSCMCCERMLEVKCVPMWVMPRCKCAAILLRHLTISKWYSYYIGMPSIGNVCFESLPYAWYHRFCFEVIWWLHAFIIELVPRIGTCGTILHVLSLLECQEPSIGTCGVTAHSPLLVMMLKVGSCVTTLSVLVLS